MPGRKYQAGSSSYRFGFNGKENDNEVKGEGNQQDYGMRIYDPRLGRFLSVDPLSKTYPWYTPYQFAGNTPIGAIDLDGGEAQIAIGFFLGALAEIAEQTVSIATENMQNGRPLFDGWGSKVDWADVATSGVQGMLIASGTGALGEYIISEMYGNAIKSAVDVKNDGTGVKNIFDGSKTQEEWGKDMAANTAGSLAGGAFVGTKSMLKKTTSETSKKIVKQVVEAGAEGTRTGLIETTTGLIADEVLNPPKSNTTSPSSTKTNTKQSTQKPQTKTNSTTLPNQNHTNSTKQKKLTEDEKQKFLQEDYWKNGRIKKSGVDKNGVQFSSDEHNPNYVPPKL